MFHSKQRECVSTSSIQTKLVKMLTSKTKTFPECGEAYILCFRLWEELCLALLDSNVEGTRVALPSKHELATMQGCEVMLRLALMADFYRYLTEDLFFDKENPAEKLSTVRAEAFRFLTHVRNVQPEILGELNHPPIDTTSNLHLLTRVRDSELGIINAPPPPKSQADSCLTLYERALPKTFQNGGPVAQAPRKSNSKGLLRKRRLKPSCSVESKSKHLEWWEPKLRNRKASARHTKVHHTQAALCTGEDSVRWSGMVFSVKRKSYYSKLIRAFQVVKNVGHPTLTLNSEWGLSWYYNLASAYTTNQPLEMAAACLPQLRKVVNMIHSEHFEKLGELKFDCQMLLYAALNCHINWVDHNHKQILLVPREPSSQPPHEEGDLRCSRCLKNQTFHSSEVKGNPRNIDVEFDFE